jgi:DNA-binding response OmpR family regulator
MTSKRTALLVEDEAMIAALAVDALEELGYAIVEAANAKAALEIAAAGLDGFDIAVIDVGLPDGRGDALALQLRGLRGDLPIIIATGYGASALDAKLGTLAKVVVLNKPYEVERLQEAATALLES